MRGYILTIYSEYKKFLTYFFIFLQYTEASHSNICFRAFNESKEQNKNSQQERVVEPNTITKDKAAHPSERAEIQSRESNTSNKNHSPINETSQDQLEEWLEQEAPEVSEFFQQHHTILSHSVSTGTRTFNALINPTDTSPSERSTIKMDLERYVEEMRKSSSLSILMAQKLVFQMSQYLAANGITHTVAHRNFIENTAGHQRTHIHIQPSNDNPLGRLAKDFYEKYNGGQIIYEPIGLNKLKATGAYQFEGYTINLSEVVFLDLSVLKNSTFLHELLHAKIHRDFEHTSDSPYHLTLSGELLLLYKYYHNYLSFLEMVTHQQGMRIFLRRLTNSSTTEHNKIFEELKEKVDIGLNITESIETALTTALRFLHETWQEDTSKVFTTPYLNQLNFGSLEISFSTENPFTLQIPFRNSEELLEIEEVQRRLEFALKTTQFHQNLYFVVLYTLRRAERIDDRAKRILLLRALQSSQILAQKFDPNAKEESLTELESRMETIYRQSLLNLKPTESHID